MNHAKDFAPRTLRSLNRQGLAIVGSQLCPDEAGGTANGRVAYLLSDGRLLYWGDVIRLARSN